MKCSNQSFHLPKSYKDKILVGCDYYGTIIEVKQCANCPKNTERKEQNND